MEVICVAVSNMMRIRTVEASHDRSSFTRSRFGCAQAGTIGRSLPRISPTASFWYYASSFFHKQIKTNARQTEPQYNSDVNLMLGYYLRAAFSKVRKCQIRKTLKDNFMAYMEQNLDSLALGLKANSLKYTLLFGRNVSPILKQYPDLFRDIKASISSNISQLDAEGCLTILQILNSSKCQGNEQPLILKIKQYAQRNPYLFTSSQLTTLQNTLYLLDHNNLHLTKTTPRLSINPNHPVPASSQLHLQLKSIEIPPQLRFNYHEATNKLLLNGESKSIRIVGVEESEEWLGKVKRDLDKAEAVVLQLEPEREGNRGDRREGKRKKGKNRVEELIGVIKGVGEAGRRNTPYVIKDVEAYLSAYDGSNSFVFYPELLENQEEDEKEIDFMRSILKHVKPITKSVLLADLSFQQQLTQLALTMDTRQLRQHFGFLRLMFLNTQLQYLTAINTQNSCISCGGSQFLPTPIQTADPNLFPLQTRHKLLAVNLHHYLKSTPYKTYSCFVSEDFMLPTFKYLCELYRIDGGWTVDRELNDLEKLRPRLKMKEQMKAKEREEWVNKFALLESLYGVRMNGGLPVGLRGEERIYEELWERYRGLLYPVRVRCKE